MTPYKLYVFDLDGTLYRGDSPIDHAVTTVNKLLDLGAKVSYVTNNSTQTRKVFGDKLNRLGFPAAYEQIETSATATADYCRDRKLQRIGVIGEQGLFDTLKDAGLMPFGLDDPWPKNLDEVVAGLCRDLHYHHISKAMEAIQAGARFIATNKDATLPLENGTFQPGAGAGIAAIETCSGVSPLVIGKPEPYLINQVMEKAGLNPKETLVIGDRLSTDIASGKAAGADTWLVLTGVETVAPVGQDFSIDLRGLLDF